MDLIPHFDLAEDEVADIAYPQTPPEGLWAQMQPADQVLESESLVSFLTILMAANKSPFSNIPCSSEYHRARGYVFPL